MRIARRLAHVLIIVLTLIVGATAAAIIVTQTAWFKNWLRVYIEREANQYLNGQMSIGRLGGNLFFGVEMENVAVSMDGSQVVAVKDLGLDYNVFELISKGLSVNNIRLNKPVIYLRREGDTWAISRLVRKQAQEADREGPVKPIDIEDIGISDGSVTVDGPVGTSGVAVPKRFEHLDAKLNFKYEPVRYSIQITHVSFRGSEPAIGVNALSGGVSVRNDTVYVEKLALRTEESSLSFDGAVEHYLSTPVFKIQISSDKTSIPEIARIVPALAGVRLQPAFELKADGPLDKLGIDLHVRSSAGEADGKVVADLVASGESVNGNLSVRHLDLSPIVNHKADKSDLTAEAQVDLHAKDFSDLNALQGSIVMNAPRLTFAGYAAENVKARAHIDGRHVQVDGKAAAYGASATAAGQITLPEGKAALAYDLHGRADHVDLRKLPKSLNVPPAATDVNANYHVIGSGPANAQQITGHLQFSPSDVAGMRIAGGSSAGATIGGRNFSDVSYRADATVQYLDLERVGREFTVASLANDRFKSDVNGHLVANGSGTRPGDMRAEVSGTLTNTSLMGGTIPSMTFAGGIASDTAHVKATGAFSGFDPAVASGKPAMKGQVGGTLDVDATVAGVSKGVTPDGVSASGTIDLQPSTIGGLAIDRANIDADYRDSAGQIRAFNVTGRDLNVNATGTLALNDAGSSNLKVHADTSDLAALGQLVDQPVAGIAKIDGTVTGNKTKLQAAGNLTGDGIKYGDNGALTMSSDYTVTMPGLNAADAQVSANTRGTFVSVAGQDINELTAKTAYSHHELTFDVAAKQPQRSLSATGAVALEPQQVRFDTLALQTQGRTWQLRGGSKPIVDYAGEAVVVHNVALVNGNQEIGADGTFGKAGQALKVTLSHVDLASVDAMLLRPPQLSGEANANATITGTKDAPKVQGDFHVAKGGFRQFHYDSLDATVDYTGAGVTLDAKLQQNANAWLTAKGYVPAAALALSAASGRPHHDPASSEERFDVHIDSSPIDLGVVQGFTTQLTGVTGTVQAKIDVTGAADDPHPLGEITVKNGAMKVEPTGVAYTGLNGTIELQNDRVHIGEIKILDNQNKPLSVSGDLAVHELSVGTFNVALKADDFKVIDNNVGSMRIKSDLRLTGELANPRLEGELGVTTGKIDLDPILAQAGDSAYATTQTEYGTVNAPQRNPNAFDALAMDIHLTVPDDLVVKGQELKTTDAPIGLGALNLTLGGDLTVSKVPWDQIRLVGIIRTIRGTYNFQGRQFAILRDGTVRFEGLDELDPSLDIRTQRVIQGVEANVNIRGTLNKPDIQLTSNPPLEQADILSLIVFNQPINNVSEGQQITLAQRAEGMAAGAVAGELANSIGGALNIDEFQIQMAPDSGATAQVTLGQQVGQNLYVKVQQDVGDSSSTNFIFEYQLKEWLRLQSNFLQGNTTQQSLFRRAQGSGADLIFVFSY